MKLTSIRSPIPKLTGRSIAMPPKQKDAYYYTPEHIAWSKAVLARAAGSCERCGRTNTRLYADHIAELKHGGDPLDLSNGQALCGSCHTNKTNAARIANWMAK